MRWFKYLPMLIISFSTILLAQNVTEEWIQNYSSDINGMDMAVDIKSDNNSNFIVLGAKYNSSMSGDFLLLKYDSNGKLLWSKSYDGGGNDMVSALVTDAAGNIYATGSAGMSASTSAIVTIKYSPDGTLLWAKKYNGPVNSLDQGNAVAVDNAGNVYVCGSATWSGFFSDYAILKYDQNGNLLWVSHYNGPGNFADAAQDIAVDNEGNSYVTGMSSGGAGFGSDYGTVKLDKDGNQVWVKRYNGSANSEDVAVLIKLDDAKNIFVSGTSLSKTSSTDITTLKYSNAGDELWTKIYNGPLNGQDQIQAAVVDAAGNIYIGGNVGSTSVRNSDRDFVVIKYSSAGNESWAKTFNGTGNGWDNLTGLGLDPAGNVYAVGQSMGTETGNDYVTLKYNSNGDQQYIKRYNSIKDTSDQAAGITVVDNDNFVVTGVTKISLKSGEITTIKYKPEVPVGNVNLVSPANGSQNLDQIVTLAWAQFSGAAGYDLQIATDESFTSPVQDLQGITSTSKEISGLNYGTTYYWRVRAKLTSGYSNYSDVWHFAVKTAPLGVPVLLSPGDKSIDIPSSVTLKWQTVDNAEKYNLQVATDADFTAIVNDIKDINTTEKEITSLNMGDSYFWRVQAVNSQETGKFSDAWSFTTINPLAKPILSAPANNSKDQLTSLSLSWNSVAKADKYDLQVATDNAFTNTIVNENGLSTTSKEVTILKYGTTYYWRVKAKNSMTSSEYSEVWNFTTRIAPLVSPVLISPENYLTDVSTTPLLIWHSVKNADSYHLNLSTDAQFSLTIIDSVTTDTSLTAVSLAKNTKYYWKITAVNSLDKTVSPIWMFTTTMGQLGAPVLISPADSLKKAPLNITFSWNAVTFADKYHFQLSDDAAFTKIVYEDTVAETLVKYDGLSYSTNYFWRVRALNSSMTSNFSTVRILTTIDEVIASPALIAPINGAENVKLQDTLKWSMIDDVKYHLQLAKDSLFKSIVVDDTLMISESAVGPLDAGTIYYWRVQSLKNALSGEYSEVWHFTTIMPAPGAPQLISPSNGIQNQPTSLNLVWGPIDGVNKYIVQVSLIDDFVAPFVDDTISDNNTKPVKSLKDSTLYYWRVAALGTEGPGEFSEVFMFKTTTNPHLSIEESWIRNFNPNGNESYFAVAMKADINQNIYIIGQKIGAGNNTDYLTIKYDSEGNLIWWKTFDGGNQDMISGLAVDENENVYVTGTTTGPDGKTDFLTIKYTSEGKPEWMKNYNGPAGQSDKASAIALDLDGNIYVTGSAVFSGLFPDIATVKYSSSGEELWAVNYSGTGNFADMGNNLAIDDEGFIYIAGGSNNTGVGTDFAVIKYDKTGNQLWSKTYNGSADAEDIAQNIAVSEDGFVYVNGTSMNNGSSSDVVTIKYDKDGNYQWMMTFDGWASAADQAKALTVNNEGVYIGATVNGSLFNEEMDMAIVKYNPDGWEEWVRMYNGTGNNWDYLNSLGLDPKGNIYAAGQSFNSGTGPDYATLKYEASGEIKWSMTYNSIKDTSDQAVDIAVADDNNLYVTGTTRIGLTTGVITTIKYKQTASNVSDVIKAAAVPTDFNLAQNYPNPFNPSTTIKFNIPVMSKVKLDIYNTIGQKISTLVDAVKSANTYEVQWQSRIASGVYFYRLEAIPLTEGAEPFIQIKKMILLK